MENNDSNLKPQQTGGLKLMTVFIAVLALHVIVIGGFTVYHLLSVASSDQDVTLDKAHKVKVLSDGSLAGDLPNTDGSSPDKSTSSPTTTTTDGSTTPSTDTASTSASTAPTTPPAPTTAETPSTPTPAPVADAQTAPVTTTPTAETPSGPIQHGPVIDPPENLAPVAPATADASSTAASPAADNPPAIDGLAYIVKPGDSLARIARQHHLTLAKLRAANSFSSDLLHIGQKIMIPNRTQAVAMTADAETPAMPADTTAPVTTTTPTVHHAHLAGRTAMSSAAGHHFYTVVKGDTLTKIARKFRTTPSAIMSANNITDAARLSIGKKLKIPAGESRNAAASNPASAPAEPAESKGTAKGQLANFVQ